MSTRKSFPHEIAARARRIGWEVKNVNDGYQIIAPHRNGSVSIHLSPSDVNSSKVVMRELEKLGFKDAEETFTTLKDEEREAKIERDRIRNQEKLAEAQRNAESLSRAAGDVRLDPTIVLVPVPVPKTYERVLVTPDLASKILDRNTSNRPIRVREVKKWAEVIQRGDFYYTHQGIAIDTEGNLQDGQHRLSAIAETGITCKMQISVGMPKENFSAIDNGIKRSFGDVIAKYALPNAGRIGSATRMVLIYNEYPDRLMRDKVSNAEVDRFVRSPFTSGSPETNGEVMRDAVTLGMSMWSAFRISPSASAAVIFLLWQEIGREDAKLNEFLVGLQDGANLRATDPRLVLRRTSINRTGRDAWIQFSVFIKCWNKYVLNVKTKVLSFSIKGGEDLPKIQVP